MKTAVIALALALGTPAALAQPGKTGQSEASPKRQSELHAERRQLQARLAQLKKQLAATEGSQSDAADALADSEAAISAANRKLRELAAARRQVERQIAALTERGRLAGTRQSDAERELGQLMQAQFALSRVAPWRRLLEGEHPAQLAREHIYLDYLAHARVTTVNVLRERREELAELEVDSRAKRKELDAITAEEQSSHSTLLKQQSARKQTLERLSKRIATQRQSIAGLERDDKRLSSLIDKLAKLMAESARRATPPKRTGKPLSSPSPQTRDLEPPGNTAFERLRGKLPFPVAGNVFARFGAPRPIEGTGTAHTWKGVFIRAAEGAEVKSIAAGRVVFADWLRGFGNLIIVDHGEGFLSVYGNNESLLQAPGERVSSGEVIASVGNTGGNVDAGLYFEIRFNGRPIDPMHWLSAR